MAAHDHTDDGRTDAPTDTCDSCGADGSRHTEHVGSRPIAVCDSCGGDWFRPTGGRDALRTDDEPTDEPTDDGEREAPRSDRPIDPPEVTAVEVPPADTDDDGVPTRVHYSSGTAGEWLRVDRDDLIATEGRR